MLGKLLHICALMEHHPDRTEPTPYWEIQQICIRGKKKKHQQDMKKKAQYVEISHACRAQKWLEPINIILLQVLLLKVANTASTLADFSLVGCRFFFSASATKQICRVLTVNYTGGLQYKGCHLRSRGSAWVAVRQCFSDGWLSGHVFYVQREGERLNVASVWSWRWGDIMT